MQKDISYTLKKSKRAKRLRLAVYCDGSVVLTSPFGMQQSLIEKFLFDKRQWVLDKVHFFSTMDKKAIRTFSQSDYVENKKKALAFVKERVAFYNEIYLFSFRHIFIKNQKTRWGSCSHKNNLNFNYKILFLPETLQDYIIVHELCHLKELNHSKKFWALVKKTIPDYKERRKELRHQGLFYR